MPATLSRFPLLGMRHKVNVLRRADGDDGAGGLIPDAGAETRIYTARKCRITTMTDEDEQKLFGNASGQRWWIVMVYSPNIARSDFIALNAKSIPAPIPKPTGSSANEYRVLYVKSQIDDMGKFHHTSVAMELEDQ